MSQALATAEEYLTPVRYKMDILVPDESLTKYTYNGFHAENSPFVLTDIDVNLAQGNTGTFKFRVDDTKDRVLRDNNIDCGYVAVIKAAKREEQFRNIMYGIIDSVEDSYPIGNKMIWQFEGLGFGVILNYTILSMIKSANKEDITSENTVINDPSFRINNLTKELFESTSVLPISNSPTLKVRGGFLLDSLATAIKEFIPAINAPLQTASSILQVFASASGNILYIDPDKNVMLRPPYRTHSGITIRQWEQDPITGEPLRPNDPADFTSYYFGAWSSKKTMKTEAGFFNRVYLVINTDEIIDSASGQTSTKYTSLSKKDICQEFDPKSTKLFNVTLLLEKVGTGKSSVEDALNITGVRGIICESDENHNPSEKIVATFEIPYDQIPNAPTPIYKIDLQYNVPSIDQNKRHMIILLKTGETEDNTVRWYHDNDFVTESTETNTRYSGTKVPFTPQNNPTQQDFSGGWSVDSSGPVHRFSFFATSRTTIEVSDPISIRKYTPNRPIEIRVNAPWVHDMGTGFKFANVLLQYGAKLKKIYEKKQVSIPDKLFFPLELCNIIYPPAGIDANSNTMAEVNNIRYSASGGNPENPYGSYFVELTAVGYMNHFQNAARRSLVCPR